MKKKKKVNKILRENNNINWNSQLTPNNLRSKRNDLFSNKGNTPYNLAWYEQNNQQGGKKKTLTKWQKFLKKHKGKGKSMDQLSRMYKKENSKKKKTKTKTKKKTKKKTVKRKK